MQLKPPLKNTLAAAAADGLSRLFGFVTTAYLARVLGTASFGVISIGLSVLGYAVLFSTPGVNIMGMREVAGTTDARRVLINEITSLRLLLAFLAVALIASVGALVFGVSGSWLIVVLFSASSIPFALSIEWYFQGKSRVVSVSVSRVLMYCCYLALVLFLVRSPGDLLWTPVAFWVANLVPAGYLAVVFWNGSGSLSLQWAPARWRSLLRASFPLGLSSLLMQTIVNMPILIAGGLLSIHETGLFSASMKLLFFVLMIDRVFNTIFFPAISRYRRLDEVQFPKAAVLGMKVMVAFSLPVAVIGAVFAATFTSLVYGPMYLEAAGVLQWLLPYFVCTTTNTALMCILYADKRDAEVMKVLMLGTGILVVLCLLLGLVWRGEGIAAGLSAGEGLITLLLFLMVGKTVRLNLARTLWPLLASGLVMGVVMVFMREVHMVAAVALGLLLFLVALFVLKGVTMEDIRFLRQRFV